MNKDYDKDGVGIWLHPGVFMKLAHFRQDMFHGPCLTITPDGDSDLTTFEWGEAHGSQ